MPASSPTGPKHILLVDCPDRPGLVHQITGGLFAQRLNVSRNDEFVEPESQHFFMRTEIEGDLQPEEILAQLKAVLGPQARVKLLPQQAKALVVLATKEPHCLGDLLIRHQFQELPIRIKAVISNHETLRSLVEGFDLPFHAIPHQGVSRAEHEAQVLEAIQLYQPDLLVLAKYMRILRPEFIQQFPARMINIHHSFLPAFIGANPYRQAYDRGVKIIGATAHIVTDDLDEGPILAQDILPVDHRLGPREMALAGRDVEKNVLAKAVQLMVQDRVFIHGNRTIIF